MVAGLRARLSEQLTLEPLPIDGDLALKSGPLGLGKVQTWAFSTPKLRKVVLSHVSMPPLPPGALQPGTASSAENR